MSKVEKAAAFFAMVIIVAAVSLPALAVQTTPKPATHSTKGTIASINGATMVINQTVRGKSQQLTVTLDSQTQRSGNLSAGRPVTVQYREENRQKIATAVRESGAKTAGKPVRVSTKPISNKS